MTALTPEQLAARWLCSGGLVRKMVRSGDLKAFRIGDLIRVKLADVEAYECGLSSTGEVLAARCERY